MKVAGIYKITNIINNKVYIGQSNWLKKRIGCHKNKLRKNIHENSHLQTSWNKYGEENFIFEIIEICEESLLNEREMYWISFYNSSSKDSGYNKSLGGDGNRGYKHTEETKKKMRENHANFEREKNPMYKKSVRDFMTEEEYEIWRKNISLSRIGEKNHFYGKHHSEETKEKISRAKREKYIEKKDTRSMGVVPSETKEKYIERQSTTIFSGVVCINNGILFTTIKQASEYAGVSRSLISSCCASKARYAGELNGEKLVWRYKEEYEKIADDKICIQTLIDKANKKLKGKDIYNSTPVRCIEDGNIFESAREAGEFYGIDNSSISKNCKGKLKSCRTRLTKEIKHFEYI